MWKVAYHHNSSEWSQNPDLHTLLRQAYEQTLKTCIWSYLQLFSLPFPDWTDVFLHQSSIEVNNTFRKITECFLKKKLPRQSLNLNSWVGGNINQIQLKSQKNLPQFNVCIEIAYLRNTLSFDQE